MIFKRYFSSPEGDIPVSSQNLAKPLKMTPSENHPFLILNDYFRAIEKFLSRDAARSLMLFVNERLQKSWHPDQIDRVLIRSEKQGALYQIASVEIRCGDESVKAGVSAAISQTGQACLCREFDLLTWFHETLSLPYLPKPYFKSEVISSRAGRFDTIHLFLTEWFDDFHEWHLSINEDDNRPDICVWNLNRGNLFLSQKEGFEVFRQCARILTLCYDFKTARQVYPWHHAAGDFVIKTQDGAVDVRLTTVRGYEPVMESDTPEPFNPVIALVYFFLNLSVKMRLDKLDGTGKVVFWTSPFWMEAIIRGFFEGLRMMEKNDPGQGRVRVKDIAQLLKGFNQNEFATLFGSMLEFYDKEDPTDIPVIRANLQAHIKELYDVFRNTDF
jgi:hypothetical protein